jgi:hypothetical protein
LFDAGHNSDMELRAVQRVKPLPDCQPRTSKPGRLDVGFTA